MTTFDFGRLQTLSACDWSAIHAMPVQNKQTALLDIVFVGGGSRISVIAKEMALANGDESFCLDVQEFSPGGWWKEAGIGISSEWMPRNIHEEFASSGHATLLVVPRRCRVFVNTVAEGGVNSLQAVVAVEFSKLNNQVLERIVLVASQDFPCTLVLGTTDKECDELLQGLTEISL